MRHLRVVAPARDPQPQVSFCGHCGTRPGPVDEDASRVCVSCGLGLLISADADAVPSPGAPFLVVDSALTVCAMSKEAEELLGVLEPEAIDRRITDFLVPADAEGPGPEALVTEIMNAGRGGAPLRTVLRPSGEYGVRMFAHLAACGPPRAALVVLDAP